MGTRWLKGALAAGLTSAAVLIGSGVGSAALTAAAGTSVVPVPGSVLWSSARAGAGSAVAADPHGGIVFAAGPAFLIAYDAATGAKLWSNSQGAGQSVAVSPDGATVFVIKSVGGAHGADYSTAAFDTAAGQRLWVERYNGPANGTDRPTALAVSPSGNTVFVTGMSQGKTSGLDYATVAYASASGKQLWASRYNGQGRSHDAPAAIAVSPSSNAVFVTGVSFGSDIGSRFATVAYAAASGRPMWAKSYDKPSKRNAAASVAVSRDGHRVFVTGGSIRKGSGLGFAIVAYAAGTGNQLWLQRYHAATDSADVPVMVLFSQSHAGRVIVVGDSVSRHASTNDYFAVAYTVTGQRRWANRFARDGFTKEDLGGAALSPEGRILYLTGSAFVVAGGEEPSQSLTIAANVGQGAQLWSQVVTTDLPNQAGGPIAVSPGGSFVYIGVQDFTATAANDFTTFALRT